MTRAIVLLLGWLAAALPVSAAESFSLDNVVLDTGAATYRAARLDFTDSALGREEVLSLLSGGAEPASKRLAKLSAVRIASPEVVTDQKAGERIQHVVYRDFVLEDVSAGRIARARAAAATMIMTSPRTGEIKGTTGPIVFESVDLPGLAHLLTEARSDPDEAAKVLAASGQIDSLDFDLGGGAQAHVDRIVVREMGGRALAVPASSLVDLSPKPEGPPPSPERRRAMAGLLADILTSQSIGRIELQGARIWQANGTRIEAASFAVSGVAQARIARIDLDRFAFSPATGRLAIARGAVLGVDFAPILAAATDPTPRAAPLRFDRIELDGLASRLSSGAAEPVPVDIGHASIEAQDWRERAPGKVSLALDHLALDLPRDDPRARLFLDLGYRRLDVSVKADTSYDAEKRDFAVPSLSVTAPDIGSARLSLRLSNVSPDLLGADAEKARAALAGSLFRHANTALVDNGLLRRLIDEQAKRSDGSAESVRARWAVAARNFVTAQLAGNPDRGAVADAAEKFIRNGGTLTLEADAPSGIGLLDVMLAGGWQNVLGRVKLIAGN